MAINKVFYRSPHNYDWKAASDEASISDFGPSLTVQADAEELDLNVIMKRFGVTGQMPEGIAPLQYGDFDGIFDFRSAQHALIDARERFMAMPAEVRARFANDPQMFLEFCENKDNIEELRRMGLAVPKRSTENVGANGDSAVVGANSAPGSVGDASGGGAGANAGAAKAGS